MEGLSSVDAFFLWCLTKLRLWSKNRLDYFLFYGGRIRLYSCMEHESGLVLDSWCKNRSQAIFILYQARMRLCLRSLNQGLILAPGLWSKITSVIVVDESRTVPHFCSWLRCKTGKVFMECLVVVHQFRVLFVKNKAVFKKHEWVFVCGL